MRKLAAEAFGTFALVFAGKGYDLAAHASKSLDAFNGTDVDVADESTQLARWNILVQSGTAMLSQANQSAQTALRLIQ